LANLQFGVNLWPHQWRDAARIEELGYDSVWTSEHVFFYFPTFDALTTLAAVAALTSRIRLGTAVLLLPLRPAALAAKEITSVDVISGGRLTLGIGVGGGDPKGVPAGRGPAGRAGPGTRRAGRLGEGSLPYLFSPERYRDSLAAVRQAAEAAGRDPDAIEPGLYQFICLADRYGEAQPAAPRDPQTSRSRASWTATW